MNKSYMPNVKSIERKWYVIDAEGKVLGRLASEIASILRGKKKPTFTPNANCGDYVIVVNAEKIKLTGNKLQTKLYRHHSGYSSGLKTRTAQKMLDTQPQKIVEQAVRGMLQHNTLGDDMYSKLFVYCGPDHKHQAQKPEILEVK